MTDMQSLVFKARDGKLYVDDWPEVWQVTDATLACLPADTVQQQGEFLTIQVANGYAHYWIREHDTLHQFRTLEISGGAYVFK